MVSLVTDYVQDTAAKYLGAGIAAVGNLAGNAVGGVGGLIENSGRAVGSGVSGGIGGVGGYINGYGDSLRGSMAPDGPVRGAKAQTAARQIDKPGSVSSVKPSTSKAASIASAKSAPAALKHSTPAISTPSVRKPTTPQVKKPANGKVTISAESRPRPSGVSAAGTAKIAGRAPVEQKKQLPSAKGVQRITGGGAQPKRTPVRV